MNKILSSNKPKSRVALLAIGALLFSGGVLGGLSLLQRQAATGNSGRGGNAETSPQQAEKNRQATIVKATELRDKWKFWALEHKQQLRAMSSGEDKNGFILIRNTLPDLMIPPDSTKERTGELGITNEDLGTNFLKGSDGRWRPNPDPNIVAFAWHIPPRIADEVVLKQLDNDAYRRRFKNGQRATINREKTNFSKWHDIEIASGSNQGFQISLWATGRVTEQKWPVGSERVNNPQAATPSNAPVREILPPYDFLK